VAFHSQNIAVRTGDGRNFILLEDLLYTTKAGETIVAQAGSASDGASTPKEIWSIIPPFGSYWLAAVLHDYLYRVTNRPKDECDSILLEAMESLGVPLLLREAIYEGVHVGGEIAFDDDRRVKLKAYIVSLIR
jgi:Protein of unknown function (DUF1353)